MTAILHVELVEQTSSAYQLRLWRDNPNEARTRTLALADIAALVGRAETDYYSPLPARLEEVGRALYRWLDGGERWLTAEIEAAANQAQVFVLAIETPHGLAHLPWEVLHDGITFLVHALNPPVLPVRWRNVKTTAQPAANRPLQALFMASSPENVQPVLDYEQEEHQILEATQRWPLDLVVEESGCVDELGALMQDYGAGFFDVLHLTGHAGHSADDGTPVFVLEDTEGQRADATALDLARKLPHRPPLVFLSGCRTGQNSGHGEVRSLAEQLIANGFRAVLGWGRPVLDNEATLAAQAVYQQLAAGESLPFALVRAHAALLDAGARDRHLLRLFCAGDPPGAFVTPVNTPGRRRPDVRPAESEFLDPLTKSVKVATRAAFVGRRRLLQRGLRWVRPQDASRVGLLLRGQGGRGKSSVAARLCNRLRREFQRVVVIGRLDESSLINAWAPELPDDAARHALREPETELRYRIEAILNALADAGRPAPLFVLDDFEQNQPQAEDGDLGLAPHAAAVLLPLFQALTHSGVGRVLITCRYALPAPFADSLHETDVPPLDATEQKKQSLRLDQKAARQTRDPELLAQALIAADGNPRLFEWLHSVLERPGLDHAGILAELRQVEEKFRENILARRLIATLPEDDRVLLGRMLLLNEPVPLEVVRALEPERSENDLRDALVNAAGLSLVDVTDDAGTPHYRVPRQLAGGEPPVLEAPDRHESASLAARVLDALYPRWWPARQDDDQKARELVRLAAAGGRTERLVELASITTGRWLAADRYGETQTLLDSVLDASGRHPRLLLRLARALLDDAERAGRLLREAEGRCPADDEALKSDILFNLVSWLCARGELDEALRLCRDEILPIDEHLERERDRALTLGQIADILMARGELDEALRIRREEELPVFERLGDVHSGAVTLGKIAEVLEARGELDEALRIRREEQLPVYERLGDVRARAVTLGKIADVLAARGELDEALRIRREEQLPVFERLGDVRSRAVTLGKIADVLAARGDLDEALRIRREEELPVYERLGDVRSRAVTLGQIADVLEARGDLDEALRIRREELLPVFERLGDVRERAVTLGQIADVLAARGELDEALRIRREEQLPVYERLGAVRSRAVTLGKIADVLSARGELDEALRIRREEQLPVFERLGDVRSRAVALGKIADVLTERGELDEALRIRREEELPVYERLGDVRSLIVGRVNLAMTLVRRGRKEDAAEVFEHLFWGYHAAQQRGYAEAAQVAEILQQLGVPPSELE
jgi:tetratricopeptide (TPR) repeat protein